MSRKAMSRARPIEAALPFEAPSPLEALSIHTAWAGAIERVEARGVSESLTMERRVGTAARHLGPAAGRFPATPLVEARGRFAPFAPQHALAPPLPLAIGANGGSLGFHRSARRTTVVVGSARVLVAALATPFARLRRRMRRLRRAHRTLRTATCVAIGSCVATMVRLLLLGSVRSPMLRILRPPPAFGAAALFVGMRSLLCPPLGRPICIVGLGQYRGRRGRQRKDNKAP